MNSCKSPANKKLLSEIRSKAKAKSKIDKSLSYVAWLNLYSKPYGVTTYKALKEHLAAQERKQFAKEEEVIWYERLSQPRPWDRSNSVRPGSPSVTMAIPGNNGADVPWPSLLCGSHLFTFGIELRRNFDEDICTTDDETFHYQGEELFMSPDQTVLMALILLSKGVACGNTIEFSLQDFENSLGCKLEELGMPFHYEEIERSLWRLTHCTLTVESKSFKGPFLIYADTRKSPDSYQVKINPELIKLYLDLPNFWACM
jgi:hypothetical protein